MTGWPRESKRRWRSWREGAACDLAYLVAAIEGHENITFHLCESFAVAGDAATALRLLARAVEHGFYPHDYIAWHCPFLAALRGTAEFERIVARAAERVAAFTLRTD